MKRLLTSEEMNEKDCLHCSEYYTLRNYQDKKIDACNNYVCPYHVDDFIVKKIRYMIRGGTEV